MAFYKHPCRHCGALLPEDSRFCPCCGSGAPFGELCPSCLREISREMARCSDCGRALYITCPHCGGRSFVGEKCEVCGKSLMKQCPNLRCGQQQFFENKKCTACGTRLN